MTVLKTNWITKLVTLVEDNPLVKGFGDVEVVLTSYLVKIISQLRVSLKSFQRFN